MYQDGTPSYSEMFRLRQYTLPNGQPVYAGDVMSPAFISMWVDRSGTCYFVPECRHEDTAEYVLGTRAQTLEDERGWLHFSIVGNDICYIGMGHDSRYSPSQAQMDVLFDVLYSMPEGRARTRYETWFQRFMADHG
jgi:hypothetical protein